MLRYRQTYARRKFVFSDEDLNLIADESDTTSDAINDQQVALEQCLSELRPKDRELIRMRYAPDMSGDEIAELLGRPVNSVYQSVGRIRQALAECIRLKLVSTTGTSAI